MTTTQDLKRFLVDLDLPDILEPIRVSASGDLRTLAGIQNLRVAQVRRAMTANSTLAHRPTYGSGLPDYVEDSLSSSAIARKLRRGALADPRVIDASVTVSKGTPSAPYDGSTLVVRMGLTVRGDSNESTAIEVTV